LIANSFNFLTVMIDAISAIEHHVDDFVRKNELVLSTTIGYLEDEEVSYIFVEEIYTLGASAIIFLFKDTDFCVPEKVIKMAQKEKNPLFTISWECRFSEILDFVIKNYKPKI